MPVHLDMLAPDFDAGFAKLLASKREAAEDVDAAAAAIIADVRARGDAALAHYCQKFDRLDVARLGLAITRREIDAAVKACEPKALAALELAHDRVLSYHQKQKPTDARFVDALSSRSNGYEHAHDVFRRHARADESGRDRAIAAKARWRRDRSA